MDIFFVSVLWQTKRRIAVLENQLEKAEERAENAERLDLIINTVFTIRISDGRNAIASVRLAVHVRPSVCFHSIFGVDSPLTLNFCM